MKAFGLFSGKKSNNNNEVRIAYNKTTDTVTMETQTPTQTAEHKVPKVNSKLVVIDCGTTSIRAGFAGEKKPLFTIPTIVGKSTVDNVTKKFFGESALSCSQTTVPMERGFIKDFNVMEDLFEDIFEHHMQIKPELHQLMLTEPFNNPSVNREKITEIMFEKFQFNSFFLAPSTPMGMQAYGGKTGVVVESGASQTHVMAFENGDYIPQSYRNIPLGGNDLDRFLRHLLVSNNNSQLFIGKPNESEILNNIKCIGCYVVFNYEDQCKRVSDNIYDDILLPDKTTIRMKTEAYEVPELLFKPEKIGIKTGGLIKNIFDCIESCELDLRPELYANICLCGGNTMFLGIENRMLWEVSLCSGVHFRQINKINALPDRDNLIFSGTSLLGASPVISDYLISFDEYYEVGGQIVNKKKF